MACLGIGLLVIREVLPSESDWTRDGIGTALLLVAASILFVVVFETLSKADKNLLATVASSLTAIFGYAGTMIILGSENSRLMAVAIVVTFYIGWIGMVFVLITRLARRIFTPRS